MITVPEAAVRVGRDPETVRRWIRSGRLRSTKAGTQHLIDEQELDAFTATTDRPRALPITVTGEPMPDFVAALRRSRSRR